MAAARKLKVFRTAIGFDDAVVAAPSRKAALAAWGAEKDLFAIGSAEQVTDPALMRQALAKPGEVIRRSRGSIADHLRAASKAKPNTAKAREKSPASPPPKRQSKPKPRPSRNKLDEAEQELAGFDQSAERELTALRQREAQLAHERTAIEAKLERVRSGLEKRVAKERSTYDRQMERWREA
jgi:hypothetical protein